VIAHEQRALGRDTLGDAVDRGAGPIDAHRLAKRGQPPAPRIEKPVSAART
jgi:hypothetical protein